MNSRQARCIFGCDTFGVSMHGFPNKTKYPTLFEAWVSVIPENMAHEDPEKVAKSKVCDYHFKPEHRTRGHGITKTAIPCLYLEGVPKVITDLDTEHNYCLPRMKLAVSSANVEVATPSSGFTHNTASLELTQSLLQSEVVGETFERHQRVRLEDDLESPTDTTNAELQQEAIENKCRICLQKGTLPIYNDQERDIAQDISTFGDIEISEDDDYPKFICNPCLKLLDSAIVFRKTAKICDQILRNASANIQKKSKMFISKPLLNTQLRISL